jgi:hypothetical protein
MHCRLQPGSLNSIAAVWQRKPPCNARKQLFCSRRKTRGLLIIDSSSLPMQKSRDMGLNDETEVRALLGLGTGTISEVFQVIRSKALQKLQLKSARSQAQYSAGK